MISNCRWDHAKSERCGLLSEDLLSKIRLKHVGAIGGYEVYVVRGEYVRDYADVDFTEGGNPARYGYIPLTDIWVESTDHPRDKAATILHEVVEAMLMVEKGWSYDKAHDWAAQYEDKFRHETEGHEEEDLLRQIHPWFDRFERKLHGHSKQASQAHAKSIALMKFLSGIARRLGVSEHVYVVGGAVRNFILKEPVKDIDVVIDVVSAGKDSEWFAKEVIKALPVPANYTTNQYGVAILTIKGDWILDGQNLAGEVIEIANSRSESYTEGGYKPESVSPATIEEDMVRREFTFNTLLWRMHDLADGPDKAEILDLTGCGLRDLQDGVMRCPTNPDKTFSDDASRMVRAIKFLIKYGFKIAPDVEASIRRNRQKLKNVPPSHLSKLLLDFVLPEATGKKALVEMERLGLLDVVKEIAQTDEGFQQTLSNRADEAGVPFLFTLMDFGLPSGKRLTFLPSGDRERVREITVNMTRDEGVLYVERLASPKLDNRAIMAEFGLAGKAMGQVRDTARKLMLETPALAFDPDKLTAAVRPHLTAKQARLLPVTEWQEALGKLAADAKFKSKKEVPKAEGKGTTTVYEYSERQVANRNHAKAEKIEKLRGSIDKLRAQVKKDLTAGDEDTRLTALAVGLMDETFERVGNPRSAEDGHFGVTGWLVKHVTLGKGKATVKYVGKSGVSHDKTVEDKGLLAALKKAVEGKKPGDSLTGDIGAEDVNAYLEPFDITAKDLRGFHANVEMQKRLKAIRAEGGKLPDDKKEREKKLKDEFTKALDESAEAVGHEAATLRTQYLVPGLEEAFMKDGTVEAKLDKQAKWAPVLLTLQWKKLATKSTAEKEDEEAERLVRSPPKKKPPRKDLRRERVQDEDTDDGSERPGADTDPDLSLNYKRVAQLHLGTYAIMLRQAVVQSGEAPKPPKPKKPKGPPKAKKPKGPPEPEGAEGDEKHKPGDVEESKTTPGNWVAWHPTETWEGGVPKYHTFKKDEEDPKGKAELYAAGKLEVDDDPAPKKPAEDAGDDEEDVSSWSKEEAAAKRLKQQEKDKAKADAKERAKQVLQAVGTLKDSIKTDTVPKHMQEGFLERSSEFSEDDWQALGEAFGATTNELGSALSDGEPYSEQMMEEAGDALSEKLPAGASPQELGQLLAHAMVAQQVVANPKLVGGKAVSGAEKSAEALKERSQEAYSQYAKATPELRRSAADQINETLRELPEGSNERKEYESIRMGLSLAMVAEGEKPTDSNNRPISRLPSKRFSNTIKMLAGQGRMEDFIESGGVLHTAEGRGVLRDTLSKLKVDDDAFVTFAGGSKGPSAPLLKLMDEWKDPQNDYQKWASGLMREFVEDLSMLDATTGDALLGVAFEKAAGKLDERERADLRERIEKSLGSRDANLAKLQKDLGKYMRQEAKATGPDQEHARKQVDAKIAEIASLSAQDYVAISTEIGGELPLGEPLLAAMREMAETGDMSKLDLPTVPAGESPESYAKSEREKQLALDELEKSWGKIHVSEPERSREDAADIDKTFDKGEEAVAPKPEEPEADEAEGEKKPGEDKAEADKKPEPSEDKAEKPKIKRPENWRADEGEVELHSKDDFDAYSKEHTVKTPAGSVMLGVHHLTDDPEDVGNVYFKERVIPEATKAVEEALKNGKKPVFLAEGEAQDYDLDVDEDYSEQHALAKALHKEFGDKVKQDTWDDDSVSPYDLKSKLWESLTSAAGGDQTKAQTAMMAFMLGQNDSPDVWRDKGILTDAVAKSLKDQFGVDVDNLDDAGKKKLFEQAFPRDSGKPETEISAVGDAYNAARQENLLKRMKEIEADGGAAIVIPGGTHAWNLKPVVEKGGEGKAEKPSEEKKPKAEKKPEAPSKEQTAEAELEAKKEKEEPHKEGEAWKTENGHWAYKDDKGNIQVILKSEENAKEKAEARAKGKDFEPEGGAEDKAKKLGFVGVRELSNAWGKVLQRSEGLTSFQSFPYRRSDISRGPICARALSPSRGDTKMPLTKEGAQKVTSRLDEIASAFQKNYETWGIPKRIAADFCMRCDMLSDAMEKMAGIKRQALTEYDPVNEPTAIGGEDPEQIGENKAGPLRQDSDESFMKGEFTQQEKRELRTRVEKGDLGMKPNLEEMTIPAGRQAASIDGSIDRLAKQAGEVHIRTLGELSDGLKVAAAQTSGSVSASVSTLSGMVGNTRDLLITANAQGKASSSILDEVETVTTAANEVLPYVSDMKTAGADASARIGKLVDLAVKVAAASSKKIQASINA